MVQKSKSKNHDFVVLSYKSSDLSAALTKVATQLFCSIQIGEILHKNWNDPKKSVNYQKFVDNFNQVQAWTTTSILTLKSFSERIGTIEKFIKTAYKCVKLNNFHSAFAIYAGICSPNINRLKKHWKKISPNVVTLFQSLENLFSPIKNHKNYQDTVSQIKEPIVPYIGIFSNFFFYFFYFFHILQIGIISKFLFAIEENNPSILSNGMINLQKLRMIYLISKQIINFKNSFKSREDVLSKSIQINPVISELYDIFDNCILTVFDDKHLYEISCMIQPKENK